jgi:hypothetical protein
MKTEFKGTKGKWKVSRNNHFLEVKAVNSNKLGIAVHLHQMTPTIETISLSEENEANAKLIAAAPELLEALQDLMSQYESKGHLLDYDIDIARQSINKALN